MIQKSWSAYLKNLVFDAVLTKKWLFKSHFSINPQKGKDTVWKREKKPLKFCALS